MNFLGSFHAEVIFSINFDLYHYSDVIKNGSISRDIEINYCT